MDLSNEIKAIVVGIIGIITMNLVGSAIDEFLNISFTREIIFFITCFVAAGVSPLNKLYMRNNFCVVVSNGLFYASYGYRGSGKNLRN